MKLRNSIFIGLFVATILAGCSSAPPKSPDVSADVRASIAQAGLKDVSISQDRDKGVVTLGGHVETEEDKSKAESIAKGIAAGQVVANEIAVLPPSVTSEAKAINSDVDKGIEQNLDAALISSRLQKVVKYDVKNAVVTLTGEVDSTSLRSQAEKIAAGVPYVKQVVNELQVKDQKATSSK